jgi:hypothetical protein
MDIYGLSWWCKKRSVDAITAGHGTRACTPTAGEDWRGDGSGWRGKRIKPADGDCTSHLFELDFRSLYAIIYYSTKCHKYKPEKLKMSFTMPKNLLDASMQIVEIDPTNPPADVALTRGQKLAAIHADAEPTSPFPAADVEGNPEDPIDDEKIETFLLNIVDRRITKSDDLFLLYKEAGFTITGKRFQDKNSMRVLMRKPRFRERLKYLINTEWEVTQPNKLSLASMYEEIADDSEMSPQARLKAIDGLAKLAQADKEKSDSKAVSVVFNFSERPKELKDVTPQPKRIN